MPYRALFFDLGNVLVPFDFRRSYGALEACSPLTIAEMSARLRASTLAPDYECGRLDDGQFFQSMSALLELECSLDDFREIWNCIFLPPTLVPEELLVDLRPRYTLLLLSNTNAMHFEFLRRHCPHLRHFHHLILSHEVGAQKPDAAIYRQALEAVGVRPEEVFFTDDLQENIEAARALGIDGEQFVGVETLEQHLRARGILDGAGVAG
ncbi:MAG: HAD family phosphatase [Bryobacterales bacterium]|jgi:putative hydrolase of the HAD superfamily|nr:HAD family phosphatase [Bryobacterales bacterium]